MWAVDNRTPYAVQRAFLRNREGAEVWVVVVRATFEISEDGSLTLAEKQQPVVEIPEYLGEPGRSSLRYDTDLVLDKPATDVLLHGHACAPPDRKATRVTVGMQVGPLLKQLEVWGDRSFVEGAFGVEPSAPVPFARMPIVYERAFGGCDPRSGAIDPRNPVGTGSQRRRSARDRVPNVVDPRDESRPAGFGPIARDWEPRRSLAGTFDQRWEDTRFPLFPRDLDERFFQCAPSDQQSQRLAGGERVVLQNLTSGGLLRFRLPLVRLAFATHLDDEVVEHRGALHTVILEPDHSCVQLVWQTQMDCHSKVHKLTHTLVAEETP